MALKIERATPAGGRQIGSLFVVSPEDAILMVQDCQTNGIDVLGVEGFRLIGDRI